jgi:hypothetical protein
MMPEEWPIAAAAADDSARARPAGRDRLATVRADFFLDPGARLTEQERALMTEMLRCLISDAADEIRAALPNGWAAANDESNLTLVELLSGARLLDEAQLFRLLLRRADEERIAAAARSRTGRRDARVLQGLVSHDDGAVSAAAMAVILARGRRRDRFGQCLIAFDDLSASCAVVLTHAVAAALRQDLVGARGSAAVDRELAAASERVIGGHETGHGIDSLMAELATLLDEAGQLNSELILTAAHEGEIAFVAAALGKRAGISGTLAAEELLSGSVNRIAALFRMASLERKLVAGLLAGIGDLLGLADPASAIGLFDRMTEEQVAAAKAWLSTPSEYRAALAALGIQNG